MFEGPEKSVPDGPDLKISFLKSIFEWINVSGLFSFEFLESFSFCDVGVLFVPIMCTWVGLLCLY